MRRVLGLAGVLALLPFVSLEAQDTTRARRYGVLSVQPLSAVFTVIAAEYEHAVAKQWTLGLGGTQFDFGFFGFDEQVSFVSGDAKVRYYAQGVALEGFSFGGSVGYTRVTGTSESGDKQVSVGGPSVAALIEYQFLLGGEKRFAVAIGAGAKTTFVKKADFKFSPSYPTSRISVGYAF